MILPLLEAKAKRYVYVSAAPAPSDKEEAAILKVIKNFGTMVKKTEDTNEVKYSVALDDDQPSPRNIVDYDELKVPLEDALDAKSKVWISVSTRK